MPLELQIPERSALQSGRADSWVKSGSQSSDTVVGISVVFDVVMVVDVFSFSAAVGTVGSSVVASGFAFAPADNSVVKAP